MLHCSAIGSNSCTAQLRLHKAGPDIAGKLTVAIAVDLVLATRPNASTGIERYAINLFKAMREQAPDTVAFVDRRSTVLDGPNVIAVDGGFRGWLALPRSRAFRAAACDALVCPAFPPSPLAPEPAGAEPSGGLEGRRALPVAPPRPQKHRSNPAPKGHPAPHPPSASAPVVSLPSRAATATPPCLPS